MGNRLTNFGSATWTYNTSNELASTPSVGYGYDLNGNAVTKNDSTGITTYAWDFENRLISVTLPGTGGAVNFKYDPFGRRIYKSSNVGTSIFAYEGAKLVEEVNAGGGAVALYLHGANIDEPLAMLRGGITSYYDSDGLSSVTSLTNAAGAVVQTYTYGSFGSIVSINGSLTNPFLYTGREFDSESSLYYYRARYFDPITGRFLSEDPISFRGGNNFFEYAKNNPIRFSDPTGLSPEPQQPGYPTGPIGKAGCELLLDVHYGGECKSCVYQCRGYGGLVTYPQAVGKACPSIDPVTGLIQTGEIDPKCNPNNPAKPPCNVPAPNTSRSVIALILLLLLWLASGGKAPLPN